jgi:hypothetical protein
LSQAHFSYLDIERYAALRTSTIGASCKVCTALAIASIEATDSRLSISRWNSILKARLIATTDGVERCQPEVIEVGAERLVGRRNGELRFLTDEELDDGEHFNFSCRD